VPWMLGVLGPPWLAVHTPNTIREDPKMSADVMSRSVATAAVVPDSTRGVVKTCARAGLISPSATPQGASQVTGHDPPACHTSMYVGVPA